MNLYLVGLMSLSLGVLIGLGGAYIYNRKLILKVKECNDVFHPDVHKLKEQK